MNALKLGVVSCLYLGCSPFAPGTFGTLGGVAIAWALKDQPYYLWLSLAVAGVLYAIGRALGPWSEAYAKKKDPGFFVLDEVIGYLITVAWLRGPSPIALVTAFFVFRFFDVFKPRLARKMEALGGGDGILLDDVVAGAYGLVLVMLPARFLIDVHWTTGA
ncbi:MAG TPA: phosphatidylglycerophosphatase A [Planctomycetota bacterium]|nr:phosphatidylglycerophosphatase A [Planctomycetota bacterium]